MATAVRALGGFSSRPPSVGESLAHCRQEDELCLEFCFSRVEFDGADLADGYVGGCFSQGEPGAQKLNFFHRPHSNSARGPVVVHCLFPECSDLLTQHGTQCPFLCCLAPGSLGVPYGPAPPDLLLPG